MSRLIAISNRCGPIRGAAQAGGLAVGLLDGGFLEGLQAQTPEQAVVNLAESFGEWHRDTFESCLEDG